MDQLKTEVTENINPLMESHDMGINIFLQIKDFIINSVNSS